VARRGEAPRTNVAVAAAMALGLLVRGEPASNDRGGLVLCLCPVRRSRCSVRNMEILLLSCRTTDKENGVFFFFLRNFRTLEIMSHPFRLIGWLRNMRNLLRRTTLNYI
jgi:hypothetical protein